MLLPRPKNPSGPAAGLKRISNTVSGTQRASVHLKVLSGRHTTSTILRAAASMNKSRSMPWKSICASPKYLQKTFTAGSTGTDPAMVHKADGRILLSERSSSFSARHRPFRVRPDSTSVTRRRSAVIPLVCERKEPEVGNGSKGDIFFDTVRRNQAIEPQNCSQRDPYSMTPSQTAGMLRGTAEHCSSLGERNGTRNVDVFMKETLR